MELPQRPPRVREGKSPLSFEEKYLHTECGETRRPYRPWEENLRNGHHEGERTVYPNPLRRGDVPSEFGETRRPFRPREGGLSTLLDN